LQNVAKISSSGWKYLKKSGSWEVVDGIRSDFNQLMIGEGGTGTKDSRITYIITIFTHT